MVGARYPRQGIAATPYHVVYHVTRILVYAVLGFISGAIGGALDQLAFAAKIPGVISMVFGAIVIVFGLSYLGWLPFWKRSIGSGGWWTSSLKSVMKASGWQNSLILGGLNGILPCGLVYESLLIAGASGNPWVGALGMFTFGLATLPALVVFGVGAQMISLKVRKYLFWAGGVFVILIGILLILRGVRGLGVGSLSFSIIGIPL